MRRLILAAAIMSLFSVPVNATWSIVAMDKRSGQIVIASATCVPQSAFASFPAQGLKDVQAIIIPGRGVAAAQASVDRSRRMQRFIANELERGTDPVRIIDLLQAQDASHASRQYGIVDSNGRTAGHSGSSNGRVSLDRQGRLEGTDVYFSVQGNILSSDKVVTEAVRALQATRGSLADRVLAALEAADANGGDRRCNCNTPPDPPSPCDNKTAHVAYLVIADRNDRKGVALNDGKYRLELQVADSDIKASENDNPVKTLRIRYEEWRKQNRSGRRKSE
jgi:uncharacterized Ntn-hydrolase superfamily protein